MPITIEVYAGPPQDGKRNFTNNLKFKSGPIFPMIHLGHLGTLTPEHPSLTIGTEGQNVAGVDWYGNALTISHYYQTPGKPPEAYVVKSVLIEGQPSKTHTALIPSLLMKGFPIVFEVKNTE